MVDYVIETNDLSKIYSKTKVVDSIDMHVERGKIYGLLGKNYINTLKHIHLTLLHYTLPL